LAKKSTRVRSPKISTPALIHAIRIAAVHTGSAIAKRIAAPALAARLTYRKGPLLTAVEVFTIFWGAAWREAANKIVAGELNAFFDLVLTSPLIDRLSEYDTAAHKIGHGRRIGTVTLAAPPPTASVTDTGIQQFLRQSISSGSVPKPTPNTLYFIYVPPGVRVVMGGSASCQAFCGYHDATADRVFYAVMPYPGCGGCRGSLSVLDALTSVSSHELCEAITDPIPGQGWYDDTYGEVGDICPWRTKQVGKYAVQLEWSNKARACV
jgi:hypothetical protein